MYWGCCAADIIQYFKVDPDAKASIQVINGDGGIPMGDVFAGKTYREIFWSRLRFGTFSTSDMPNHAFFAILTEWQLKNSYGKKWLAILKEAGFEFFRTVNNSVYSGQSLSSKPSASVNSNDNYIFILVRNIGNNSLRDPFTPPKEWTDLPKVKTEAWEFIPQDSREGLTLEQFEADKTIWNRIGKPKFYKEAELEAEGVPVWYGGNRNLSTGTARLAQTKEQRQAQLAQEQKAKAASATNAFPTKAQSTEFDVVG